MPTDRTRWRGRDCPREFQNELVVACDLLSNLLGGSAVALGEESDHGARDEARKHYLKPVVLATRVRDGCNYGRQNQTDHRGKCDALAGGVDLPRIETGGQTNQHPFDGRANENANY